MKKLDIVIGLPSRNEADSIGNVVRIIDKSLTNNFPQLNALLYNIDSGSDDATREVFELTETTTQKKSYNTNKTGKGHNLLHLFKFALDNAIPYICTFDTDLTSITEEWVVKVLTPLINGEADYVVPVYGRNKYEANTTNHFCYPILAAHYGTPIRQPYAGDFGLNLNVVKYLLNQSIFEPIYQYGIDIWMTTHSVGGNFTIKEVYLGKKIHKPSFPKMVPMFGQAAATMFKNISEYKDFQPRTNNLLMESSVYRHGVDDFVRKPSDFEIAERTETALSILEERKARKGCIHELIIELDEEVKQNNHISAKSWSKYLAEAIKFAQTDALSDKEYIEFGIDFTPFYLLRVLSFFKEVENIEASQVDQIINSEVEYLKDYLNG